MKAGARAVLARIADWRAPSQPSPLTQSVSAETDAYCRTDLQKLLNQGLYCLAGPWVIGFISRMTVSFGKFSMSGRVEVKHLVGAALLVLLSFQRAHADPVGETHRVTTEKTAALRDAERSRPIARHHLVSGNERFG